jgi:hypothetical protein
MTDPIKPQENEAAPAEKSPEVVPAEKKEPTMAEIQKGGEETPKGDAKPTVGLDKYMSEKTKRQELQKEVARLNDVITNGGGSKEQIADDIEALTKEYEDVDPQFLNKLVNAIEARAEKKFKGQLDDAVKPLKEEAQEKKINEAFQTHFDIAMENMPEYKDVVDPKVIKSLSLDPDNEDKTFAEIIEETYGEFVTGKKTMEDKTQPGGGKEPESVDFARAKKDPEYFKTVLANPKLKAEYNRDIHKRIG